MVKKLSINNYKSIKGLSISTKRVNIFIGEHNSGKSNILEALSWFSINALDKGVFSEMFRFKSATDFFYDFDATKPISIKTNEFSLIVRYAKNNNGSLLNHLEGIIFKSDASIDPEKIGDWYNLQGKLPNHVSFRLQYDGTIESVIAYFK
jgi:AAA15 family ATPase/GTPase